MRIIGGTARGKKISLPKGASIRPTADHLKEALFSILQGVEGEYFLDLFAGCGGVGLEALSRGAKGVVFVEKDWRIAGIIKKNVESLEFSERAEVITAEAQRALQNLRRNGRMFDIVFADPPYERGYISPLLKTMQENQVVAQEGIIVIQHSRREPLLIERVSTEIVDQRSYGDTLLTFLKNRREEL